MGVSGRFPEPYPHAVNLMSISTNDTQPTSSESTPTRDQGRVLLVTDELTPPAYNSTLERAGFAVVGVAGGAAALVAQRRTRPHIIVVDVQLKGISTNELARMLVKAQDGVPFVLVGEADATAAQRSAALQAGAFDYFQVPQEIALLVGRISQVVALKQTMNRLRAEADLDFLTGLANRRRFRTALTQEVERWRRYGVPCALILMDIDNLKQVNDTYGHPAGDAVIRHVANVLAKLSRDNDTAARMGGEEFALLLAGATDNKAVIVAERVREAVAIEPVDAVGTVTVSLGVAACPAHATTERTIYAVTDAALYRAKHDGRNRVIVAEAVDMPQAATG